MNKKLFIAAFSAVALMVVASLTLVFTLTPHVSAALRPIGNGTYMLYAGNFDIEDGYITGLSYETYSFLAGLNNGYSGCGNYSGCGYSGCGYNGCGYSSCGGTSGSSVMGLWVEISGGSEGLIGIKGNEGNYYRNPFYYSGRAYYGDKVTAASFFNISDIGDFAFFCCNNLRDVRINNSVQRIGKNAFYRTGISTITIPASVSEFGEGCFDDCSNLTEIIVSTPQQYNHPNLAPYKNILVKNYSEINFFDAVGGTNIDSTVVIKGEKVIEPAAPEKEGYTFKGWYNGEEAYDFNTPVTDDLTLTAHWEAIPEPEPTEPEPTEPEPTEPEETNPETPVEQENTETVENGNNNKTLALGIAGGSVAGLGSISAVAAAVVAKRRRK